MGSDDRGVVDDAYRYWVISIYASSSLDHATASSILPLWFGGLRAFTLAVDGNWECRWERGCVERPLSGDWWYAMFWDQIYFMERC